MKRSFLLLVGLCGVLGAVPARAHHSFAAAYFEDQIQSIEGDLALVQFRNPHTWLYVDAKDEKGASQRYSIEWGSGIQLTNQGVARTTLKAGDHLVVTGNPGQECRRPSPAHADVERPADGWKWGGTFDWGRSRRGWGLGLGLGAGD
jgi:hypothetical protein